MVNLIVNFLEKIITFVYEDRVYARFYVLETVARVPYFAYLSVLHFYESLGFWDRADWIKIHFAESWNELHHLRIIESLGGGNYWLDRWVSRIAVLGYYWTLVFVYMAAPRTAYHFNQIVEEYAYHTYDKFVTENQAELKNQPAPQVAIDYYQDGDLYMFDEFQSCNAVGERRPKIENLYDVFVAMRNDEKEHVNTMKTCQKVEAKEIMKSPHAQQ